jgi:hypothetical protein
MWNRARLHLILRDPSSLVQVDGTIGHPICRRQPYTIDAWGLILLAVLAVLRSVAHEPIREHRAIFEFNHASAHPFELSQIFLVM